MTIDDVIEKPAFSRNPGKAELRQEIDLKIAQVLDAVANARDIKRCELVAEILGEYADLRLLELTLIQRVTRGNPDVLDSAGSTFRTVA